jgi:putative tricarboxylic transport membrane protein
MLAMSIPGDPIVAVLMGGLMIQGIQPGATMFLNYPDVIDGIFAVFVLGALFMLPIGLLFVRVIVVLMRLPQWAIMSIVLMISIIGTYTVAREIMDLWMLLFFGVAGYLLRKADYPLSPIVVGFVLGPIFENNFRRTGLVSQGDFVGYVADRPITLAVLLVIVLFLAIPLFNALKRKKTNIPT